MDVFIANQQVGELIIREKSSTFIYTDAWQSYGFSIAPNLPVDVKEHHAVGVHGIFFDSSPDRWGRKLIDRTFEGRWVAEKDYILGVSDVLRLGALRFSLDGGQTFEGNTDKIPPLTSLPKFRQLTDAIMRGEEHDYAELISNASLGGARAKIIVSDHGRLYIAKVPQIYDQDDVEGWEYVCLKLAEKAGIDVAECSLHGDHNNHTLLLRRFDRDGDNRIHYMSAMTLMGLNDGDVSTYIDLAFEMNLHLGPKCLSEFYRRMLFNIMVSNCDDHLRNHGFLYRGAWDLSPAFDITLGNKPYGSNHALRLNGEDADTFDTALNICEYFNLNRKQASDILSDMICAVDGWEYMANAAGVKGINRVSHRIFCNEAKAAIKR